MSFASKMGTYERSDFQSGSSWAGTFGTRVPLRIDDVRRLIRLLKDREPASGNTPQAGDILASERSARADVFTVSSVPTDSVTVTRYSAAIERVQELVRTPRVDGWYAAEHTHCARVASYRS